MNLYQHCIPLFGAPRPVKSLHVHPLRGSWAPDTGSTRAGDEPAGPKRRPRSRLAACASPQHRGCPIRRQLRVGLRCRATTADRPRPKKPRPQEPMRGLGRARLLKRHKAAWGRAKRHQPRTRAQPAAGAAGWQQRRPTAAPGPLARHRPATAAHVRVVMVRLMARGGRGATHLGSGANRRAGVSCDFLGRQPARGGREGATGLLGCKGPKHAARLGRSGGAARTRHSCRPPRWQHAIQGC